MVLRKYVVLLVIVFRFLLEEVGEFSRRLGRFSCGEILGVEVVRVGSGGVRLSF